MANSNSLTFVFSPNGGSGAASTSTFQYAPTRYPYTATETIHGGTPTRTWYNFLGWALTSNATSANYHNNSTYSYTFGSNGETKTVGFYAVWGHVYVTCAFSANGGTGAPNAITHWGGYSIDIPATVPTRTGYNFLGWSLDQTAATATYSAGQQNVQLYDNVTLYAVWKIAASIVTASDGTLGTAQTLTITRTENYADTITYSFGNATGMIVTQTTDSTVSWTPPLSLAAQIPNAASGACVLTCTSYNNGVLVGSSQTTINLAVPSSVKVEVDSVTLAETVAAIAAAFGAFVQSKSKLKVTVAGDTSGAYGATIAAYSININGQTLSENETVTSEIVGSGTLAYSVTITDTRGRTDTYTGTYNVLAYAVPTVSATAERDQDTPENIVVNYSAVVSPVNNINGKTLKISHKVSAASSYTLDATITLPSYNATGSYTITNTDRAVTNDVKVEITDTFTTVSFIVQVAAFGSRVMHISATDMSIWFHRYNTPDGKDHFAENTVVFHNGIELGSTGLSEAQLISLLASAIKSVDIPVSSFTAYGSNYYAAIDVSSYNMAAVVSVYTTDWNTAQNSVMTFVPQGNYLIVWFAENVACTVKLLYI